MLRIERRAEAETEPSDALRLAYDDRKKSRMRVWSELRREVGVFLPWGSVLREGDLLAANSGEVLIVRAAPEPLSEVRSRDWQLLARAAYHLGNRHVPLQIEPGILRYQRDHVLDEMLEQLGLSVLAVDAPFEPEAGAYSGGGHSHGEAGGHGDGDGHDHDHDHDHAAGHADGDGDGHDHDHDHDHDHTHGDGDGDDHEQKRGSEQERPHGHRHNPNGSRV